jgi:hypothetical protein
MEDLEGLFGGKGHVVLGATALDSERYLRRDDPERPERAEQL